MLISFVTCLSALVAMGIHWDPPFFVYLSVNEWVNAGLGPAGNHRGFGIEPSRAGAR
jgi:hypothetical protein